MTVANPDTLEDMRDGFKGTRTQGTSSVITASGVDIEIIAAPAAGFHLEVRRLRCVNLTTAEKVLLEIHDSADLVLTYMAGNDSAVTTPVDDTGWMDQPLICGSAKALEVNALATLGDCHVTAWCDVVAD